MKDMKNADKKASQEDYRNSDYMQALRVDRLTAMDQVKNELDTMRNNLETREKTRLAEEEAKKQKAIEDEIIAKWKASQQTDLE